LTARKFWKKTVNIKKEVESTTLSSEHTFIYPRKSFYFCNTEHLQECFNKFFFSHLSEEEEKEEGERRRRIK
jgi:hypothetical protein